ncbi:hypothetical protein [Aliikangiella coralliicola]|uniref:Lipoprotein n=1 Tax=Aliikangiella coralliicola TaxID=2592383 RepID=A0A545UGI7_9GAMM|nr:hypothetical protein [Aliikangiella coralliicola]TQV88586.1 hypothetical protein FLL46_08710 [Aliikangiella coralliicola]
MQKKLAKVCVLLGLLLLSSCENETSKYNHLAKNVLKINSLPSSALLLEESIGINTFFKVKEYHLEISAADFKSLISGRRYKACATQTVFLHDATLSFSNSKNILLNYCMKAEGIAIYSDSGRRNVFIIQEY